MPTECPNRRGICRVREFADLDLYVDLDESDASGNLRKEVGILLRSIIVIAPIICEKVDPSYTPRRLRGAGSKRTIGLRLDHLSMVTKGILLALSAVVVTKAATMPSDQTKLIGKALGFFLPYLGRATVQRVAAICHSWTWKDTPDSKNVVVLGGSFAGIQLVKRLTETLPTGYKAVWIEKNSHLNYLFNFPRFSVMQGHEHMAFIPYDGIVRAAPDGILTRVHDTAVEITENQVLLALGQKIDYAYLAIATGSSQPLPVNVAATEREDGCQELQGVQEVIKASEKIAVVGGGAVGVELASDIKDFYPGKDVTLIHSRGQLMSHFGKRLQDYTLSALREELKIRVMLNERPKLPGGGSMARSATLVFSDGHEEQFDLVIGCTGQQPNSAVLASLIPSAISKETSRILVQPTLQVLAKDEPDRNPPIFAFGDVAEHGGPHMARAGWLQSEVVLDNILAMIHGQTPSRTYTPNVFLEGAIKLTLGKKHNVVYAMEADGSDVMVPSRDGRLDLGIERGWREFGADFKQANAPDAERQGESVSGA